MSFILFPFCCYPYSIVYLCASMHAFSSHLFVTEEGLTGDAACRWYICPDIPKATMITSRYAAVCPSVEFFSTCRTSYILSSIDRAYFPPPLHWSNWYFECSSVQLQTAYVLCFICMSGFMNTTYCRCTYLVLSTF